MKTLKQLNEKVWYRFLKVIYIRSYLTLILVILAVMQLSGRDLIFPVLPSTMKDALSDPEFYKLSDFDKIRVLDTLDKDFNELPWFPDKDEIIKNINKMPVPTSPSEEKYIYESYYSWNIENCLLYGVLTAVIYILILEAIRRAFYYVVTGKAFPKE